MEIDYDLYAQAMKEALKVDFISNSQELKLYANALYSAMMWGRGIDEKNRAIRERDQSVK
ncbi:hypothetical protein [Bacteroides sp.]|uniref:hypothetical protein n=1 Tax=Bacteroides sp. TaxID=29523 RepID=UPI002636883D|nr:hypothetical protein [Bacteroides sp.]MDD3038644.1 hypothetical protein [Bacteroides sp.]